MNKTQATDKAQATDKVEQLLGLMATLRNKQTGCPWDIQQNFESIATYTIEEAYEVADAVTRQNRSDLCEELGDLLLQVIYHARMAEEEGSFCFRDVVKSINAKLIRRHPHIFCSTEDSSPNGDAAVAKQQWDAIKMREKTEKHIAEGDFQKFYLDRVSSAIPAIIEATKLQAEAEKVGFDWAESLPVLDKVSEELQELKEAIIKKQKLNIAEEYGDILFVLVNFGRKIGADFDMSLRATNQKFRRRFAYIEQKLKTQGKTLQEADLALMETLWQEAKNKDKTGAVY